MPVIAWPSFQSRCVQYYYLRLLASGWAKLRSCHMHQRPARCTTERHRTAYTTVPPHDVHRVHVSHAGHRTPRQERSINYGSTACKGCNSRRHPDLVKVCICKHTTNMSMESRMVLKVLVHHDHIGALGVRHLEAQLERTHPIHCHTQTDSGLWHLGSRHLQVAHAQG